MADGGEGEECDRAEGEDGGDGGGGVFFVRVDSSLGGHNGGNSADGGADGEQAGELGREAEDSAEDGHHGERENQLNGNEGEREAADVEDVLKEELRADEDDAELEP